VKKAIAMFSPGLAIALTCLWLLLNQTLSFAHVALGVMLGVSLSAFASTLRPVRARLRRLDTALLLILVVIRYVVSSNADVAGVVIRSLAGKETRSGFVRIPLDLRDPHGLAALAAIVTATPGTVWAGLSPSGDALSLHVLDLRDEDALIRLIKQRYERPLMQIFE
jgi:multicomponent K+:H+ antiporter subunit E